MQDGGGESAPPGCAGQLRAQHWAVKIILAAVALLALSPVLALGAAAAYASMGEPGVVLFGLLIAVAAGWFVITTPGSDSAGPADGAVRRYCESCGAGFTFQLSACPGCGAAWSSPEDGSIAALARFLNHLAGARQRNLIDPSAYGRIKAEYERRIQALRPAPTEVPAPAPATRPAAALPAGRKAGDLPVAPAEAAPGGARPPAAIPGRQAAPPAAARPVPAAAPGPSAAEMGRTVIGWAAERQADILLYVGAFLLSIAAIIFVAYQGEELSGGIRFAVLTGYAVGFLGLGLVLHRWERVKEAGPAFLALGAILVPIDFIALRFQVLGEGELPDDLLWLTASASCAALYLVLALRGYGRFYFVPAVPAAVIAWGALGSVLGLPQEWWGVWYLLLLAPGYVAGVGLHRRWRRAAWLQWFAILGGALAVTWTHLLTGLGGDHHAAAPVAYGLAATAMTAGLRWRRDSVAPAALPVLGGLTIATGWWAAFGLEHEWNPLFLVFMAAGYLVVAHFQTDERPRAWAGAAAVFAAVALLAAHSAAAEPETTRGALPATYGAVFVLAAGAFGRWGWMAAGALLPVLGGMALLTAAWAAGGAAAGAEWQGACVVLAAYGYLALAVFDRPARRLSWQLTAMVTAALGILLAHIAMASLEGAERRALPLTHFLVLAGAGLSFARWRWSWRVAPGALPASTVLTALTACWAQWDLQPEWFASFAAAAGIGYLALAAADAPARRRWWWPASLVASAGALSWAHAAQLWGSGPESLALPAAYALVTAGASAAFAAWRFAWRAFPGALPALAALTGLTFAWAEWRIDPAWYGPIGAAGAFGYIALALADEQAWARRWLAAAAAVSAAGVAAAQLVQFAGGPPPPPRAALPAAYGEGLAAASFAAWWWRERCREAGALVPTLAAAFGASLCWAAGDMRPGWLPAWAACASAGYLAIALFDREFRARWQAAAVGFGVLALFAAHAVALGSGPVRWQLPLSYAVLLAAWSAYSLRVRDSSLLAPPALAAMLGATALWAAGAGPEWWPYPALGVAALLMATARAWRSAPAFGPYGWGYAVALVALPTLAILPIDASHPAHGVAVQVAAAAMLAVASLRARGAVIALFVRDPVSRAKDAEWATLTLGAIAFLFGAAASLNGLFEISGGDRAGVFAALSVAGWLGAASRWRAPAGLWVFAPAGLAGTTVAAPIAVGSATPAWGTLTGVLALAVLGPVAAYFRVRRWSLLGIANSFLLLTVWAGWRWLGFEMAYLPLAFVAVAILEWAALVALRRYTRQPSEREMVVEYISWAPWLVAGIASGVLLSREQTRLEPGEALVTTEAWGMAAMVLALFSAALTAEGLRLRRRFAWVAGSAGLLGALLMAIATREPENVQAYTAPVGIYFIVIALTFRRSARVAGEHLQLHELVMLIGALHLVLPPAGQSFAPGGGKYGLELIGIGIALLAGGLLLHARWLVAAAILTLTATAARMVTGGLFSTPYWLLLGGAGTILLGFGFLVLLERERWDRFRHRVAHWWRDVEEAPREPLSGPDSAAP